MQLNPNQPHYMQIQARFYNKLFKLSAFTNQEYYKKSKQLRREAIEICKVYVRILPNFQKTLDRLND